MRGLFNDESRQEFEVAPTFVFFDVFIQMVTLHFTDTFRGVHYQLQLGATLPSSRALCSLHGVRLAKTQKPKLKVSLYTRGR